MDVDTDRRARLRLLTRRGYGVPKGMLSARQHAKLVKELTAVPKIDPKYRQEGADPSFPIYQETSTHVWVPRYYGLKRFGYPDIVSLKPTRAVLEHLRFTGRLHDFQVGIMDRVRRAFCYDVRDPANSLLPFAGGLLCRPPGEGKTTMASYAITEIVKRPTIVIVQREFLLNQWLERLRFFTNASIGILQQNVIDVEGRDVVVCMLQSLCSKDYGPRVLNRFQFAIFDECHHLGAKVFSRCLAQLQVPYLLGLSATPERSDGLEYVFYHYLGGFLSRAQPAPNRNIEVRMVLYESKERRLFREVVSRAKNMVLLPIMVSNLTKIEGRNRMIVDLVEGLLAESRERQVLVLSARVEHSRELQQAFGLDRCGVYLGGMPERELKEAEGKQIIVGSYAMAREALDIPSLNTLVLATPLEGSMVQTIGRILRSRNHAVHPLVVDIVDNLKSLFWKARPRVKYYVSNQYSIRDYRATDDEALCPTNDPIHPGLRNANHDVDEEIRTQIGSLSLLDEDSE